MGTTFKNLSLNDDTDYGLCFACGPRNPSGLQLRFERDGETVATTFQGREMHQGFPGYVHGGVVSALMDEVMSRVSLLENRWAMTARMDVRFRQPVPLNQEIIAIAEKTRVIRGFLETSGKVFLPNGTIAVDATGKYAYLSHETLASMTVDYPRLANEWMMQ